MQPNNATLAFHFDEYKRQGTRKYRPSNLNDFMQQVWCRVIKSLKIGDFQLPSFMKVLPIGVPSHVVHCGIIELGSMQWTIDNSVYNVSPSFNFVGINIVDSRQSIHNAMRISGHKRLCCTLLFQWRKFDIFIATMYNPNSCLYF